MAPIIVRSSRRLPINIGTAAVALILFAAQPVPPFSPVKAESRDPVTAPVIVAQNADADGDGVPDLRDACPAEIPGTTGLDASGCPAGMSDIFAGLGFDHSDHREWYERFWNGDCDGLSFWQALRCQRGEDFWARTMDIVLARVPEEAQGRMRFRLWRLGRSVGHEWARDNDVRRIHTSDISRWGEALRGAHDVSATLGSIEEDAAARMAR